MNKLLIGLCMMILLSGCTDPSLVSYSADYQQQGCQYITKRDPQPINVIEYEFPKELISCNKIEKMIFANYFSDEYVNMIKSESTYLVHTYTMGNNCIDRASEQWKLMFPDDNQTIVENYPETYFREYYVENC